MGGPHPLRDPRRKILGKIKAGQIQAVTNTEVLQEIIYRFFSIGNLSLGEAAYHSMVQFCAIILPITLKDTDLALQILKDQPPITSRDAIHAATMLDHGLKEIISTNSHFDPIAGIKRIDPERWR